MDIEHAEEDRDAQRGDIIERSLLDVSDDAIGARNNHVGSLRWHPVRVSKKREDTEQKNRCENGERRPEPCSEGKKN